ncbi:hypothetical protein VU01_102512 [Candidatus Electrothrix marina]|uniref:Uncharacterized protein n=1 Tax=Candidatus Electrothrix marina TaxID=1859130 RepID=A0A3S3R8A3_9BACT|nr:hypothetical protein VT99_12121 [Candidatus Electrothrix marina]RWX50491.1 hypothetical protein VU00_10683 [Candidatus Electrothrix marina]RWX52257.1 hypothetical protein VU01_102512 [Candidatus Electrothrix marina]
MKTTKKLLHRSMVTLSAFLLCAAPLAAQENLKVDETTVGGPSTVKLCVRDYGKTPAEAFAAGAEILRKADGQLGEDKLHGNVRIRILPEKENGMFVVEVYSFPDSGSCPLKTEYRTAQVTRP